MPTNVKLVLSVLVVGMSAAMFYFQHELGRIIPSYVSLLVGLLMILGMWIFPEVKRQDPNAVKNPPATRKSFAEGRE